VAIFRRSWVRRRGDGTYELDLPDGVREALPHLGAELEGLLGSDEPVMARLFPTAYPDDPEREAGYQALIRGELIDRHRAGLELVAATASADRLTHDELVTWMTTVNAMRLVLGTALGVEDDVDLEIDDDDPRSLTNQLYLVLSVLLDDILDVLDP
jgi:hypothetical protein